MTTDTMHRVTGRLLPVDHDDRVLLLHGFDPARPDEPFWFTVGGAVDPGESTAQAAAREAYEETGLVVSADLLGEAAWSASTSFSFDGRPIQQSMDFYVARVAPFEVTFAGHDEVERGCVDGHRWWSIDELRATGERYFPEDLPRRLGAALTA